MGTARDGVNPIRCDLADQNSDAALQEALQDLQIAHGELRQKAHSRKAGGVATGCVSLIGRRLSGWLRWKPLNGQERRARCLPFGAESFLAELLHSGVAAVVEDGVFIQEEFVGKVVPERRQDIQPH